MNCNRDCTVFEARGAGGGGGGGSGVFPYIGHIGICRPHRIGFLHRFDLKRAYTWPILVWNWVWFSRELRECLNVFIVSIPNE